MEILDFLSGLHAIDPQLYDNRIIWCENFVKNLEPVYLKRRTSLPEKPNSRPENDSSRDENSTSTKFSVKSGTKKRQSKIEGSKEETNTASFDTDEVSEDFYLSRKKKTLKGPILQDFNTFWKTFNYRKGKAEAADAFLDIYSAALMDNILTGAKHEAQGRLALVKQGRTPKWAQGWLAGRRWEDEESLKDSNDCSQCQYNQDPNLPCNNLSQDDFIITSCKSFRLAGGV